MGDILEAARATRRQISAMAALRADDMGAAPLGDTEKAGAQMDALRGVGIEALEDGGGWSPLKKAAAGATCTYGGSAYFCVTAHITQSGWEPPAVPALWAALRPDNSPWVQPQGAHDAYASGARVTHAGTSWINTYGDGNIWEPGVFGWSEEG